MKTAQELAIDNMDLVPAVLRDMGLLRRKDDFIDVGWIGLMQGCNTYDPSKGFKESTYLYTCIRRAIKDCWVYESRHKKNDISLDYEYDDCFLYDMIPDDFDIDMVCMKRELKKEIVDVLNNVMYSQKPNGLNQKKITMLIFGINCNRMKMCDVAKEYHTTMTTIQNIKNKFIKNLRKRLKYVD